MYQKPCIKHTRILFSLLVSHTISRRPRDVNATFKVFIEYGTHAEHLHDALFVCCLNLLLIVNFHATSPPLQRLPPTVIDIPLELPCNQALNAAFEPYLAEQRVVPLLVQKQLMMSSERRVHFAVLIKIWSNRPSTVVPIQEEHHALADVNEHTDLATAPAKC